MIITKLYKTCNKAGCFTFLSKQMARLSVIIPVYNTLSTLERCVRSVFLQNVTGVEVILVDDGSTDGSSAMCDALASANDSVRVIHRENGGLSAARNTGIEASSGTWLSFVDSDDELGQDTLSANLEWMEEHPETDMIEFPVIVHYGSQNSYTLSFEPETVTDGQVFRHWIRSGGYNHCYAWNKIYRRELFDDIRFPQGESFEDAAICPTIIQACKCVRYSDIGLYLYHESGSGITHGYRFKNQEPLFRHNFKLLELITGQGFEVTYRMKLWTLCLNLLTDLKRCMDPNLEYINRNSVTLGLLMPEPKSVFQSGLPFRQKVKVLASRILGVRTYIKIMGIKKYR